MAIVDPDEKQHARVKDFLKSKDCDPDKLQVFTDYRVMYEKIGKELDAVFIAAPNHHHAPAASLALLYGGEGHGVMCWWIEGRHIMRVCQRSCVDDTACS